MLEISLPIKDREIFVLCFQENRRRFSTIISNVKSITDNRTFWQTIKPNFTDKTLKDEGITLFDGGQVETEEKDVVKKIQGSF